MKTIILSTFLIIANISFTQAATLTSEKIILLDFSQTDIDVSKVKISYNYYCTYTKKFIDIISGRIGERTVSCGEKTVSLKIVNDQLVIPAIEQFKNSKAENLNLYGLQIKIDYNGRNLIWIDAGQKNDIEKFFKREFNLTFKKFELNDLEVTYKGVNLIHAPEFDGANTQVTTYFSLKGGKDQNVLDTDFTRGFKWYMTSYSQINRDDVSKIGKISIAPRYHAFINNAEITVNLTVYAMNKENQFVSANEIEIPFTQEAISNLREVELVK